MNADLVRRPIKRWFPLFILPTFLCFIIGFVWPFLQGIYLSFCDFNIPKDAEWVGTDLFEEAMQNPDFAGNILEQIRYGISISFKNYEKALADPSFSRAFWNTAIFAVVSIVAINVLAFAIAYALTQKMKGSSLFRTVFFMPNLIGGIVLGYIWQLILNGILSRMGVDITYNATYGFWGLVILMNWQMIGYMMIIYVAGLQNIPAEMHEVAAIDGANAWQALRHVTFPLVMPAVTICTFLTLTNSFKMFDQNLALTAGAPGKETEMLALNIYNTFYSRVGSEGVGQAKAVIFFLLAALIAGVQLYLTQRREGAHD